MAKRAAPDPERITPTTPLRLADAAELAFPGGGITAASLRREAERGRLKIELIAGKHFVTLEAIQEMRIKCRLPPKEPLPAPPPSTASAALASALKRCDEMIAKGRKRPPQT